MLSEYLYKYYNKKVIILIDEYDSPVIESYNKNFYYESADFLRDFYGSAFKDNIYLEKAVLTGVTRVSRESLFSGLNNMNINTVLSENMNDAFGFTEEEVHEMLEEHNLISEKENIGKYYNGYNFNGKNIYNPWSILYFFKYGKLQSYWINTAIPLA